MANLAKNYIDRLSKLELERAELAQRIDELQRDLQAIDQEYRALRGAMSRTPAQGRFPASAVNEAVYEVLKEAEQPLHYREIYERLAQDFFVIGGSAPLANLSVRLARDPRFVKWGRGMYGLAEWRIRLTTLGVSAPAAIAKADVISQERERYKLLSRLEVVEVDIKITQLNLRTVRQQLRQSPDEWPGGLPPSQTVRALTDRLHKLLRLRDSLTNQLRSWESNWKGG